MIRIREGRGKGWSFRLDVLLHVLANGWMAGLIGFGVRDLQEEFHWGRAAILAFFGLVCLVVTGLLLLWTGWDEDEIETLASQVLALESEKRLRDNWFIRQKGQK